MYANNNNNNYFLRVFKESAIYHKVYHKHHTCSKNILNLNKFNTSEIIT